MDGFEGCSLSLFSLSGQQLVVGANTGRRRPNVYADGFRLPARRTGADRHLSPVPLLNTAPSRPTVPKL